MPQMARPALGAVQEGDDRASHFRSHSISNSLSSREKKAAGLPSTPPVLPAAACLGLGLESTALVRRPPRLHEPFVSPEFAGDMGRATRLDADVSRRDGGDDGDGVTSTASIRYDVGDLNPWWEQPEGQLLPAQAAPLYTVHAGAGAGAGATQNAFNRDVLVALPSPLPPSVKLAKRLAVAAAGCLSVVKSSAIVIDDKAAAKKTDQRQRQAEVRFKSSENAPPSTLLQAEAGGGVPPQQQSRGPCQDLSSLVTEATCSWGQELGQILGQAVPDLAAAAVGLSTAMCSSSGPLALTTTGLFPQTMHLRFSSPVCVSSVHIRASSVLRLVVKPAENISGSEEVGGKAVTVVPAFSSNTSHGESTSEHSARDIDVDVRGVPSFKRTRSISVSITSGSGAFCSVRRLYALGTQA